jgi:hypothetical protein
MHRFNRRPITPWLAFAVLAAAWLCAPAQAQTTAFTYQGRLLNAGAAANGPHDLRFRLFSALTGGIQIGSMQCLDNVPVGAGLFTVQLDFGQQFATTGERYLEIEVRADTGLGCANATGFIVLSPRQPLTPAPVASHANSAFALDAPSGAAANAVFVDAVGNVGVGTTSPATRLTVAGDMEMGTNSADYRHFRIGGGNSNGFLYGSFPALGDGIHMGYNFFYDATGVGRVSNSGGQTSRVSVGYGYVALATGGIATAPVNRLTVNTAGNVGVGTDVPAAKLDVRGNVKLGTSGQYFAAAGEENLRIIRGVVDAAGNIIVGSGFTARHDAPTGFYHITFTTPFTGPPAVTITVDANAGTFGYAMTDGVLADQFALLLREDGAHFMDAPFHFTAIGPR